MLNQLSNAVALYLAPVLSLTAVLLASLSYFSPAVTLHAHVALLVVKPSLLLSPSPSKDKIDGPSVFMGPLGTSACLSSMSIQCSSDVLGSCSRPNNDASTNCTVPVLNPHYGSSAVVTSHA